MQHIIEFEEEDRQMLLLALALTSLLRPGWECAARELSKKFPGGEAMFNDFRKYNQDRTPPQTRDAVR